MRIVGEAREAPPVCRPVKGFGWDEGEEGADEEEEVEEEDEEEDEYDKRVKEVQASGEFQVS